MKRRSHEEPIDRSRARCGPLALLVFLGVLPAAWAQESDANRFTFTPAGMYRPDVPTIPALTGFEVGERFVDHATVHRVLDAIDGTSERVRVVEYGETWGGRPLLLSLVSAPENHARWSEIEAGLSKLSDPRRLSGDAERDAILESLPVVVWLSFNVHGNESSGTEAALPLLYHLAAADDPGVAALLKDAFVVIDPCLNPDGRDRYVTWYRSRLGVAPNPDPQSEEHDEPWPGGRVNHYYFDLNRDWAFLTQVETKARLTQYRRFQPQVHADLHEMFADSSYFFFPAAAPIHDEFPRSTLEFGETFGKANAAAFDRFGWTYYTGEDFDLLYPGYGDSWPSLNGAIGMTYEQAGHGRAGLAVERSDGTVLTLRARAAHHFTSALTTIETAAKHKKELLASYARFHADALWEGDNGPVKAFVLEPGEDAARIGDLVTLLMEQGVEVKRATEGFTAERCHDLRGGKPETRRFGPGAYVVSMAQPRMHLAKVLLESEAAVRENSFYDLSAWSLPLAYGIESHWTEKRIGAALEDVSWPSSQAAAKPDAAPAQPAVGWLIPWDSFAAPRYLAMVTRDWPFHSDPLASGATKSISDSLSIRSAREPFTLEGRSFGRGTMFIPSGGALVNEQLGALGRMRMSQARQESGAVPVPVGSGMTERGPDLGSGAFPLLARPSIAIASGEGTDANSVGALRWLLERRYGFPFSMIPLDELGGADLRRYNVLVLPNGYGYASRLGGAKDDLRRFVESGGVLIGLDGGAFSLIEGGLGLVSIQVASDGAGEKKPAPDAKPEKPAWKKSAERRLESMERNVPGTLFRLELDPLHPLAFGYDRDVAVLMDSSRAFPLEGPGTRVGVFPKDSLLAGFASSENTARLDGKAYLADVPLGRGHVVLFAGDPTYRGFVRGQTGLLMNALLLLSNPLPTPAPQPAVR